MGCGSPCLRKSTIVDRFLYRKKTRKKKKKTTCKEIDFLNIYGFSIVDFCLLLFSLLSHSSLSLRTSMVWPKRIHICSVKLFHFKWVETHSVCVLGLFWKHPKEKPVFWDFLYFVIGCTPSRVWASLNLRRYVHAFSHLCLCWKSCYQSLLQMFLSGKYINDRG